MEITFSCSPEDYIAYYVWSESRRSAKVPLWWQRFWSSFHSTAILLFCALVTRGYVEHQEIWKICASFAVVIFIAGLYSYPSLEKRIEKWVKNTYFGKNAYGHFGDIVLRLSDGSIWSKTELGEASTAYRGITEIVETPTHVFIMQGENARVVPRAKIKSGALEQFISQLQSYVKNASAGCDSMSPPAQIDKAKRGPIWGRSDFLALIIAVVVIVLLVSWELVFDAKGAALERYGEEKLRTRPPLSCCMSYAVAGWIVATSMFLSLPLFALLLLREKIRFFSVRTADVLLAVGATWGVLFGYVFLAHNSLVDEFLSSLPRVIDQFPFVVGQPLVAILTWTFDLGWLALLTVGTVLMLYLRRHGK